MSLDHAPVGPLGQVLPSLRTMVRRLPGMARTTVRYLRETRPAMHHEVVDCAGPPPALGAGGALPGDAGTVLPMSSGCGPVYRRIYQVEVDDARIGAEDLISRLLADPNRVSPTEVVTFRRLRRRRRAGASRRTAARAVGTEFEVDMPGPWDALVRVVDRTPTSFRLATLRGHMEAGEIEFRASEQPGGRLLFQVESVARSADRMMHLLYDRLRLTREMQMHMWVAVCLGVVDLAGGQLRNRVHVTTYRHVEA
ncbi:MAG TPA: DUF1990 family protein [Mycobacteriales bacterium]|nr:DUF1990 family protein [Mycobacteriales bacterium]